MQFLIDECLPVRLVDKAVEHGWRAAHVAHLGRGGATDWNLMGLILDEDWTFVTRNAVDFRGPTRSNVQTGLYSGVELHAGLICLVGKALDLDTQLELFDAVLALIGDREPVNQRIEAELVEDDIILEICRMP